MRPLLLCCAAILLGGCATTRTLTITSEPSGAEVLLDSSRMGRTPITVPFRYGGEREIVLLKPSYEAARLFTDTDRFWLDTFPFDAFADLGPFRSEDHQVVHVELVPSDLRERYARDPESLLQGLRDRAERLRRQIDRLPPVAAPPAAVPDPGQGGADGARGS